MFLSKDDGVALSFAPQATSVAKAASIGFQSMLRSLLGDVYAFQTAAQGAHWNVAGPDFAQWHDLFSEIYEDVNGSIDPLAENILKVGGLALASLSAMQAERTTTDPGESRDPRVLAQGLAAMNDQLLVVINQAFDYAEQDNEQGVANYLAERDDMHKKWRWQLRASLGEPVG
jgi:starvation-inducible DNA-binding protein